MAIDKSWENEIVEVTKGVSAFFPKNSLAKIVGVSECGDFVLQYLNGNFAQHFGFAYGSCLKKIGIKYENK